MRPLTAHASIRIQAPWQMTPMGTPRRTIAVTNCTAGVSMRRWSALRTPPGRTSPSYSSASASDTTRSTASVPPFSAWSQSRMVPSLRRQKLHRGAGLLEGLAAG